MELGDKKRASFYASTPPSYTTYLKITELTSLQKPLSNPIAHDEMLFIITHQTYELWFKQILYEMKEMIHRLYNGNMILSLRLLNRITEILKVLVQQVDILETMTPVEFNRFRNHLNPASGFQSRQFREFELMGGLPKEDFEPFLKFEPEWQDLLETRTPDPTLRDGFHKVLLQKGLIRKPDPSSLREAIQKIYHNHVNSELYHLCENLISFDESVTRWRFRHVQMVERMIGMKKGTGGSMGVGYLEKTLRKRFFPELWEARTHLEST